jgi:hypothetical protein
MTNYRIKAALKRWLMHGALWSLDNNPAKSNCRCPERLVPNNKNWSHSYATSQATRFGGNISVGVSLHWLLGRGPQRAFRGFLCALALMPLSEVAIQAQEAPGAQVFYSSIQPFGAMVERYRQDPRPQSSEGALQVLDWLIYGGIGVGAACDYNLNSSPTNQQQACGPRFTPAIAAVHNTGIQRTLLYGVGDISYYPTLGRVTLDDTRAGIVHVWEIQRDLIFRFQLQGTLGQNYSGFAANLLPTNAFVATRVNYDQGYGSTSIQKEFGNFFTAVGGSVTHTNYQNARDNFGNTIDEQFRDGTVSTANTRFGYYVSPILYTYVEPSYNWQQYAASSLNSQGYRLVGGVGTDRIGLFQGEIYGGYASQRFEDPRIGTDTIPVFGGHLSWYTTRFLTFTLTADRAFGSSDFSPNGLAAGSILNTGPGLVPGSVTDATTVSLKANWDFSRMFSFSGSVGDQRLDYLDSFRRDDLLTFTAGVTYKFRPNLGLTVTYLHQNLFTNFPGAAFSRDFISAGTSTKF